MKEYKSVPRVFLCSERVREKQERDREPSKKQDWEREKGKESKREKKSKGVRGRGDAKE